MENFVKSKTSLRMVRVSPIKGRHCRFLRPINVALHGFFNWNDKVEIAVEFSDGAVEFIPHNDYTVEFTGAMLEIVSGEGHTITEEVWSICPATYTTKPDPAGQYPVNNALPGLEIHIGQPVPVENAGELQRIADNMKELTNGKPQED